MLAERRRKGLRTLDLQTRIGAIGEQEEAGEATRARAGLSTRARARTRGSARVLGLLAVLAVAAVGGATWWTTRTRPEADAAVREDARAPEAYLDPSTLRTELPQSETPALAPPPEFPAELFDPARYEGTARVEVHIRVDPGSPQPERWTLSFQPSQVMLGAQHAVAREVEVEGGATQVIVPDVQLGAYTVSARAEGLQSEPQQLELAQPDNIDEIVSFRLYGPGYLTGRVVDTAGRPIAGIEVTIENALTRATRALVTDETGAYTADALFDGDYRVLVGPVNAPLAAFDDVSFAAPTLHMPDLVTPPLGELAVVVRTREGAPVEGATVEGVGLRSGAIRAVTDGEGRAVARACSAGNVHLFASHEREGKGELELEFDPLAEPKEAEIVLAVP